MKTRQNIRKRIAAARRALQITKEAERKAELASNVERLLERASPRVRNELRGAS